MANVEITNNDVDGIPVWEPTYEDDTLAATGAVTYAAGTVLGRLTATGNLTAYESGNADGSEIPVAWLPNEVEFTGAGTTPIRAGISGKVRRSRLIAHGVGALTQAEVDALRDYSIVALSTTELSELDNQ